MRIQDFHAAHKSPSRLDSDFGIRTTGKCKACDSDLHPITQYRGMLLTSRLFRLNILVEFSVGHITGHGGVTVSV